mmetsp:Transcript_9566/g.11201  ORF Transcript_9566/g.11201 Transcript_9566/m.11201 type:complete len:188 (+) Transcript_9566:55-618(+)
MSKMIRLVLFLTALTTQASTQDPCSVVQEEGLDCVLSGCAKMIIKGEEVRQCVSCTKFTDPLECNHQPNCAHMGDSEGGCTTCWAITEKEACIDSTCVWREKWKDKDKGRRGLQGQISLISPLDLSPRKEERLKWGPCVPCHRIRSKAFCNSETNKLCLWNPSKPRCGLKVKPGPFEERVPREKSSP